MSGSLSLNTADETGTVPQVSDTTLEPSSETEYAINSASQAYSICKKLEDDWKDGIFNQRAITAQLNGERPRSPVANANLARNWLPNINAGVLRVEAGKVPARLWMPIATATYLTAATLPAGHPLGLQKAELYRSRFTQRVRKWKKWPWFMRQLAREVGIFGFGFAVWFDEYEWKPTFVRQDRGFVPVGTDLLDEELPVFVVAYDYKVHELLSIVQRATKSPSSGWVKEAVAKAVNGAAPKTANSEDVNARKYEEMVRQATIGTSYEKAYNVIETYHVWSVDPDGSVSHQIVLRSEAKAYERSGAGGNPPDTGNKAGFLFQKRAQFKSMDEVVVPFFFDPDDGTIQGSWGAGQMLFDLSIETEKTINDWIASLKQAAKLKVQTNAGKNPDEVRLDVDDTMMLVTNGTYAGNTAAVTTDPRPFQTLIEGLGQLAREKIGSYIPPIPLQPRDIKAAQIRAKEQEQAEVKAQTFQAWLWQFSILSEQMGRRLTKEGSPNADAKAFRAELKKKLDDDEIEMLTHQNQIETIADFTEEATFRRAAFAATKAGNPFYDQKEIERVQAIAAGGIKFAEQVMLPGEDETVERGARRLQQMETATMEGTNEIVDVLPYDADWFHMLQLRPKIEQRLMEGVFEIAALLLKHYEAHYVGAVAKQGIPKDRINPEKSFVAKANKTIETGQIPPDGFADQLNPVEEVQAMMASRTPISRGPSAEREIAEVGADDAGREALIAQET